VTNKGGRPPSPRGPLDDSYTFRVNSETKTKYLAAAGPAELTAFMAWFNGEPDAELPQRPCDTSQAA
jgi:hypothetical protein